MVYEIHDYVCETCNRAWSSYGQAEMCEDSHDVQGVAA